MLTRFQIDEAREAVSRYEKIKTQDWVFGGKTRNNTRCRRMAAWLFKNLYGASPHEIQRACGWTGKDPASAFHAITTVDRDPILLRRAKLIRARIENCI